MTRLTTTICLLAASLILAYPSSAADTPSTEATAATVDPDTLEATTLFDRMKSLVGVWEGQWSPGTTSTIVTYSLTGNSSVLVEDYLVGQTTMSTLYHLDGDELMLTHYCSVGNQPRMKLAAVSPDGLELVFDQFDGTNLEARGYSERLTLTFEDENHIAVFYRGSKNGSSSGVRLQRRQ